MTIEQRLKEYISRRYNSIREFSISIDMPYSTIDSIFKRGIDKASVANIIRICNALDISVDELAEGNIIPKANGYVGEEKEIIVLYRSMNNIGKELFLSTIRTYAGNPDMQKESQNASTI